jgi:SAM-dependent methyltransferase
MLKNAKIYLKNNNNINYINWNFLDYDFENYKFDLIFSWFVFHYFSDEELKEVIQKCNSILENNWKLIFIILHPNYIKTRDVYIWKNKNIIYNSDYLNKQNPINLICRDIEKYNNILKKFWLTIFWLKEPWNENNNYSIIQIEAIKK